MEAGNVSENLFHVEVMPGIYLISSSANGPTGDGRSIAPGNPTGNSYLVIGNNKALIFDLAVNEKGFLAYVKKLTEKPIQIVLSHGHIDHTYYLNDLSDVWMHLEDEKFISKGMLGLPPVSPCPKIHSLKDGDQIDLGGRILEVFNVPGHTLGSLVLLDRKTKTLLSGDTFARRLLYGMTDYVPINLFCDSLRRIQSQDFDVIYSAHDRCALPKTYLEHMLQLISNDLPETKKTFEHPALETMAHLVHGDIHSLRYFDMAVPLRLMEDIKKTLRQDMNL